MEDFVGRKGLIPQERLRELTTRSDFRGWLQTISHFAAIGLSGFGLSQLWDTIWVVPVFVLHGMLINYLFAAQHELNHYTAFRTRWLNDFFNRITSFVVLYPRDYERWYHFEHHRHTQNWQRDPELFSRGAPYRFWEYLIYLVGITYWLGRIRSLLQISLQGTSAAFLTEIQRRRVMWEARAYGFGYLVVVAVSWWFESTAILWYWLFPMLATKILHQVQNITEHTGLTHHPDTVINTRTIRTWSVLRWMAWNMQFHAAHHTYPAVPFHKLPALQAELEQRLGFAPPATGYIAFQWRFIRALWREPEPWEGVDESAAAREIIQ